MKKEHKKVILKAMTFMIMELDVDVSLLSAIQQQNIFDTQSIEEISVCWKEYLERNNWITISMNYSFLMWHNDAYTCRSNASSFFRYLMISARLHLHVIMIPVNVE